MKRRAFLAAGAVAVPSVALARVSTIDNTAVQPDFEDLMKQAGNHLKSLRDPMRSLDNPAVRDDAAFLANQITILLAQCVEVADQAQIPEQAKAKYDGNKERFVTDLRLRLTQSVKASNDLAHQLLLGNEREATAMYTELRNQRKEGHNTFKEDD